MKLNATLAIDHFRWDKGTRVRAQAYWVTKAHITVAFPPWEEGSPAQCWTLPSSAVKLDKGVKLKIADKNKAPWKQLRGKR